MPVFWSWQHDDAYWDDRRVWRNWDGPDELTTAEAAIAYAVRPATVRQWVHRGHLTPIRRDGRTLIFEARAVYTAAIATGDRNQQPGGPLRRDFDRDREHGARGVTAEAMTALVTAEAAGAAVGVSPSTVRSWKRRGHISPVQHRGRTPFYLLADVVAVARRSPHRPQRKDPRPF